MKYPIRKKSLAFNKLEDNLIIIDFSAEKQFHQVNEVGSLVWHLCDGTHTVDQIIGKVNELYDTSIEELNSDIPAFLTSLEQNGLLDNNS